MIVIIMAGGMGKRMCSDLPKVLHNITHPLNHNIQYPMLIHVIMSGLELNPNKIFIVVGKYKSVISECVEHYINTGLIINHELIEYVDQPESNGTGHAIKCCLDKISIYPNDNAIILSGDVPLIKSETLKNLLDNQQINKLLITELVNPYGCGRILLNEFGNILGICEEKDCNEEEKKIKLVNCGIYQINVSDLINLIPQITNNNKSQEYYLTDIIGLMVKNDIKISTYTLHTNQQWQIKNVNTKNDLEELNNFIKTNL